MSASADPIADEAPVRRPDGPALVVTALGVAGLALTYAGRALEVELALRWFFIFAWWSYIVLADGLVRCLSGRSLMTSRPRAFVLLAVWSTAFWLVFELVNLRLANWYYVGIPNDWISRGPGVFLAFATVLPGTFETAELLRCLGLARNARSRPFELSPAALRALEVLGALFLVLPLAFPRYAYPLIWGATTLLAEPWLHRRGERGLLLELARGDPRNVLRTLAAGAVCGLLWESWNSLALSKWIYTVPFFERLKLFEMPLLGFLGFPPFALECWTFARLLVALGWVPEWRLDLEPRVPARASRMVAPALVATVLSVPAIRAVVAYLVRSGPPLASELSGISDEAVRALEREGVRTVEELHHRSGAPDDRLAGVPWIEEGHLMQVKGMGARGARWLAAAGVHTWRELAEEDPDMLLARLAAVDGPPPRPSPAEVRVWVRGARRFEPCCARVRPP